MSEAHLPEAQSSEGTATCVLQLFQSSEPGRW